MPQLQNEALTVMTNAFARMEASIDRPQKVAYRDSFVYRYLDKDIRSALVQKLARVISGLNALELLLSHGYVQEVGVIFRTLDEIQEDILFLATAETNGTYTERYSQYLDAFYADAIFSRVEGSLNIAKPKLVPRKKIRAHAVATLGQGVNISDALSAMESVGTAYSGFVHASSESIMDMYGGEPPQFHLNGMLDTPRVESYRKDAANYVYRALMSTTVVAKAFGDGPLVAALYEFLGKYEEAEGVKTRLV